MNREEQQAQFLALHQVPLSSVEMVAGDASFRKYYRVEYQGKSTILMDAPAPHEDVRPFVSMAEYLISHGFSAPSILAKDEEQGFLLLEDFGNERFSTLLQAETLPVSEETLYRNAIDVLTQLHRKPVANIPHYDDAPLWRELDLFVSWFLVDISDKELDDYRDVWASLMPYMKTQKPVTVLRDYHVDNLMWLPEREAVAKVGLLDFQDALVGHPAYDMVSLLEDARRNVHPALAKEMLKYFLDANPHLVEDEFMQAYHVLGAQRNLKIIGIFSRLARRDGKPEYLAHIPRVWRYLAQDLTHPLLSDLRRWLDRNIDEIDRRGGGL